MRGFLFLLICLIIFPNITLALTGEPVFPRDQYSIARITKIEDAESEVVVNTEVHYLDTTVLIISGSEKGKEVTIKDEDRFSGLEDAAPKVNDLVTLRRSFNQDGSSFYTIDDAYRLRTLLIIGLFFFALVIFFGRTKGLGAILGLFVSIGVLYWFIIPKLLSGDNPILITIVGALMIAVASMYLAHGFNQKTGIALVSTLITLVFSVLIAWFFTRAATLFGLGSEGAFFLTANVGSNFNFQGLLLGGIIIGMLGVLDDVTTTQTATVEEIKNTDPTLSCHELYRRGLRVGREHISSLVNTLVLAYAGAALPLFLLFAANDYQPFWVTLNSEPIAEEIVRTLAGSVALVLAVPISTWLAAYYLKKVSGKN